MKLRSSVLETPNPALFSLFSRSESIFVPLALTRSQENDISAEVPPHLCSSLPSQTCRPDGKKNLSAVDFPEWLSRFRSRSADGSAAKAPGLAQQTPPNVVVIALSRRTRRRRVPRKIPFAGVYQSGAGEEGGCILFSGWVGSLLRLPVRRGPFFIPTSLRQ